MRRSRAEGRVKPSERVARLVEDLDELKGIVALLQSQGKVVVFATGAFDLLHVGHVRCLKDARSRGDFLVLGIETNEVVEKKEGAGFPLHTFEERAEVLGAFGFVDYITRVEDETGATTLEALQPTVYAVGAHQKPSDTAREELVKKIGCNVVIVGGAETRSMRETLSKIWALNAPTASDDLAMKEGSASPRSPRKSKLKGRAKSSTKTSSSEKSSRGGARVSSPASKPKTAKAAAKKTPKSKKATAKSKAVSKTAKSPVKSPKPKPKVGAKAKTKATKAKAKAIPAKKPAASSKKTAKRKTKGSRR